MSTGTVMSIRSALVNGPVALLAIIIPRKAFLAGGWTGRAGRHGPQFACNSMS